MTETKRRFWLKLQRNFFNIPNIVYLETVNNGEKYILLWIKILLLCLDAENEDGMGFLRFTASIPYDDVMLAKVLRADIDTVRAALKYFVQLQMIEILEDGTLYIEEVQRIIGRDADSTARVAKHREKKKQLQLFCNDNYKNIPAIDDATDKKRYGGNYFAVINRDLGVCISCKSIDNLCVHHIIGYDEKDPVSCKKEHMALVCRKCHSTEHASPHSVMTDLILSSIGFNFDFYSRIDLISNNTGMHNQNDETNVTVTVTPNKEEEEEKEIEEDKESQAILKNQEKNKIYVSLAKLLYDEHKKSDIAFLKGKNLDVTFNRWANDIRLLVENDGREYSLVDTIIRWCQEPGNFWVSNILSGFKLRDKFPTLYAQYMNKNKTPPKNDSPYNKEWGNKYGGKLEDRFSGVR